MSVESEKRNVEIIAVRRPKLQSNVNGAIGNVNGNSNDIDNNGYYVDRINVGTNTEVMTVESATNTESGKLVKTTTNIKTNASIKTETSAEVAESEKMIETNSKVENNRELKITDVKNENGMEKKDTKENKEDGYKVDYDDYDDDNDDDDNNDEGACVSVLRIHNNDHLEPLLCENIDEDRFLLFPIHHNDIFDMYKLQVAQFWTAEEINLSRDLSDWQKLRPHERAFFKRILAFFAPSDGIVGENLLTRFYSDVGYTEARYFYAFQAAMENIHAEVYGLLIKNLIPDENEQNELFSSFVHTPGIKEKVTWAKRWISSKKPFAVRLVAFAVVEGLLFSGSFASIFWLKKVGLLPGLTFSNELISRDEGLHCDFACLLYNNHIVHKLPSALIQTIVRSAVEAEQIFFRHAFNGMSVGEMNTDTMLQYVRFCADRLLTALNVPKLYNVTNPFDFMHLISLDGRTNFFERRVGEYRQSRVATNGIDETKIFLPEGAIELDYDF